MAADWDVRASEGLSWNGGTAWGVGIEADDGDLRSFHGGKEPNGVADDQKISVTSKSSAENGKAGFLTSFVFFHRRKEPGEVAGDQEMRKQVKLDAVLPATPFGALVAQESRSAATTDAPKQQRLGVLGFREVHQLLEVSSHTLPPMTSLYQNLLSAFLSKNENVKSATTGECEDDEDMSQHGSDSDADMEVDQVPVESRTDESTKVEPRTDESTKAEPECSSDSAKLAKVKQFAWFAKEDGLHTE